MRKRLNISSGQAKLATEVVGIGTPIIFLHASVCDSRMWEKQLTAVGASHMAVAYDRRGFGGTAYAEEDHSPVQDLIAVIEAVGQGQPVVIVGCSQGGRIAIDLAIEHPNLVRALVLISSSVAGSPEPNYPTKIKYLLEQQSEAEIEKNVDKLNAIKAHLWLDGPLAENGRVQGTVRDSFLAMNGRVLNASPAGKTTDVTPMYGRLGEIEVPTLVAWGSLDFPHIQERGKQIVGLVKNGEAYELEGTAHLPSLERPEVVTEMLVGFLERLQQGLTH